MFYSQPLFVFLNYCCQKTDTWYKNRNEISKGTVFYNILLDDAKIWWEDLDKIIRIMLQDMDQCTLNWAREAKKASFNTVRYSPQFQTSVLFVEFPAFRYGRMRMQNFHRNFQDNVPTFYNPRKTFNY